MRKYQDILSF